MSLFMKAILFLIPTFMIVAGIFSWLNPTRYKKGLLAYRSQRSLVSEEATQYAQICMGKSWVIVGIVLFIVTLFLISRLSLAYGDLFIVMISIQVLFLFIPLAWVEYLLSRKY